MTGEIKTGLSDDYMTVYNNQYSAYYGYEYSNDVGEDIDEDDYEANTYGFVLNITSFKYLKPKKKGISNERTTDSKR